jgi:hypothetical protein
MGVVAIIAVVPHDHEAIGGNCGGSPLVSGRFCDIGFDLRFSVEIHSSVGNPYGITGTSHHSFNKSLIRLISLSLKLDWGTKDNHVSSLWRLEIIGDFLDEKPIALF